MSREGLPVAISVLSSVRCHLENVIMQSFSVSEDGLNVFQRINLRIDFKYVT